jgi:hypothetical protein
VRTERVQKLVETLERKLAVYAEQATGVERDDRDVAHGWRQICTIEAKCAPPSPSPLTR